MLEEKKNSLQQTSTMLLHKYYNAFKFVEGITVMDIECLSYFFLGRKRRKLQLITTSNLHMDLFFSLASHSIEDCKHLHNRFEVIIRKKVVSMLLGFFHR